MNIDILIEIALYLYNTPQYQISSKNKDLNKILLNFIIITRWLLYLYFNKIKILLSNYNLKTIKQVDSYIIQVFIIIFIDL